jgi:hypothetical protein
MLSKTITDRLKRTFLIGSTLGLLIGGTGIASAQVRDQVIDNPPGAGFQTQGIREEQGKRGVPSANVSRTARGRAFRSYGYTPRHVIVVRPHRVHRYHYYD